MNVEVKLEPALEEVKIVIHAPTMTAEVEELLRRLGSQPPAPLLGFREGEAVPLELGEVLRFYSENKEVHVQTVGGVWQMKRRLYELEELLDPHTFVRISQSEIVNLKQVTALDLSLTGTIKMTLAEGAAVAYVSRRYVKKIKQAIGL